MRNQIEVNDTINATEYVARPSIEINEDGTYAEYDCPGECETGTWSYDKGEKVLKFKFKKPKYNVPIENLAPGLLEKLKANGQLMVFEGDEWEIESITKDELTIIEHLAHDEFEFLYNLRVYRKKLLILKIQIKDSICSLMMISTRNFGKLLEKEYHY